MFYWVSEQRGEKKKTFCLAIEMKIGHCVLFRR